MFPEFLLEVEAWKLFQPNHPKATLCIAGEAPFGFDKSVCSGLNIDIILQFLTDEQYFNLGSTAHCIILPYTKGTNSGVVSTLITLNSNIITSDLEMFKSNTLLSKELMFESGNPHSLVEKMELIYANAVEPSGSAAESVHNVDNYRRTFRQEVLKLYEFVYHY